ncbi:hypothetical protein FB451DRAFT_202760 [Mycena latifolia]|nr:hypothetical protein FB451DRAFT_202760 [Mycena latifolia]
MGLTKDVTHLFAVSTTSEKYQTGMSYRDQTLKVLVPDWFDDSVLFGYPGLSTETYEWPDPAVLKRHTDSPGQLQQAKKQQRLSMSPQKKALYKTASGDPSKTKLESRGVWGGCRILLSTTLELTGSRRKIVEDGIRQAQGVPVAYTSENGNGTSEEEFRLLDRCDVFVTRYRTGKAFYAAWRKGKKIGTLSWLLNVQVTGVNSSPLDQLLHFPIPHGTIEGFDIHEICVTNYTGEARDYLKKLMTVMGGNFTPSLSNKNTVLIAAQKSGSKTSKADEWSIPVVNHTWLEDCFLRWKSLTPATKKYISYPAGFDFASILGERGIDPEIKEQIDREAAADAEDGEEEDSRAPYSQNSADETEVEGGLMPPDMDVDKDLDGGADNMSEDVDFDMDQHKFNSPAMSFEDAPSSPSPQRIRAGPSTPKTPKSAAPSSPAKPKSAQKKHIRVRGLSTSSESQFDPEVKKKVVRVVRPASTTKPPPKKKAREESEADASQDDADEEPKKKATVVTRARRLPRKKSMDTESEAEASQLEDDEVPTTNRPAVATRTGPPPRKKAKPMDSDSEAEASQDDDEPVSRPPRKQLVRRVSGPAPAPRRSPRKAPDSQATATTSKLPDLHHSDSDMDDLPVQLAPPAKSPKAPVPGGIIKAARIPPSEPPKRQSTAKAKAPPRKTTPTPPSSPLSALSSPKARMPTKVVEVVMPDLKGLSASARKPPPTRTHSISAISHHRATPVSAPPRSRVTTTTTTTTTARASSPPSSVATPEYGGRVKRSAATKATQRLHDEIMPDVVNFQNEMRNRGRKSSSRRVSGLTETEEEELPPAKKRKVDGGKKARASTSDVESVVEQPAKPKPRKSEAALRNGKAIKLMTTGVELSDDVLKALANLGAKVTARPTECTHLIVEKLLRTEKFLCALAGAPFILMKQWAEDSAAEGSLMPEDDYLLQDDAAESKYGFRLSEAVVRARELKGKLFKDHVFYVTPKVHTNPALLRSVVLAHGGQIILTNQQLSSRILAKDPNRYVISCEADEKMCSQLPPGHPIYSQELVLTSALKQEIDWSAHRIVF